MRYKLPNGKRVDFEVLERLIVENDKNIMFVNEIEDIGKGDSGKYGICIQFRYQSRVDGKEGGMIKFIPGDKLNKAIKEWNDVKSDREKA